MAGGCYPSVTGLEIDSVDRLETNIVHESVQFGVRRSFARLWVPPMDPLELWLRRYKRFRYLTLCPYLSRV